MQWSQRIVTMAMATVATTAICVASFAAPAVAAPGSGRHLGAFAKWPAAQRAAKFKLLRPTRTYGHKRNGPIVVSRCEASKRTLAKHVVTASYGRTPFATLSLSQNNSGGSCAPIGKVKRLGSVKVEGTKAVLTGKCGMRGLRSCKSRKIFMFLTWRRYGIFHVASSFGLSRKTLAGFARGLRPVG